MSKEELKDYLKKNLSIEFEEHGSDWYNNTYLIIKLDGEPIIRTMVKSEEFE